MKIKKRYWQKPKQKTWLGSIVEYKNYKADNYNDPDIDIVAEQADQEK